jgi:formylglycine-generating enzyme required for sulfatase activity
VRIFLSTVIGVAVSVSLPLSAQDVFNLAGYTNGLGMKFVPVPGTQVLFSVYETRAKDFRTFVEETGYVQMRETEDEISRMWSFDQDGWKQRGHSWEDPGFHQTDDHPVVGVSWHDAKAFCEWLTLRERAAGRLPSDREYRLPTDNEWSVAVGFREEPVKWPEDKDGRIGTYPWSKWSDGQPPPQGVGNYTGAEDDHGHRPEEFGVIFGGGGTNPVGAIKFKPNQFGLYVMNVDVWEWCENQYSSGAGPQVLRAASWLDNDPDRPASWFRIYEDPGLRNACFGFRCVVGACRP